MADTVSKHIDMTTGSLWRNIPLFAFPVATMRRCAMQWSSWCVSGRLGALRLRTAP